jgi:protein-disulfide isomerase
VIEGEAAAGLNPAIGPDDAPVTVIEFSDYLCPHCRKAMTVAGRIRDEYRGLIRWVYMDFPLEIHPGAKEIARAPRCARDQGKFWEFHERLLAAEGRLGPSDLEALAGALGLDVGRFRTCMAGTGHADEVERDMAEGIAAGVSATPTFLVNGKALVAPSYVDLKRAVERALRASDKA